jgi:glutathione S-transferase
MSASRLLLFYSDRCPYCTRVIATMAEYGIRHLFMLVDVDVHRATLPANVERVPLVMDPRGGRVCTDDAIYHLLAGMASQEDRRVPAYHDQRGGGFSDGFMELDGATEGGHRAAYARGFTGLDVDMSIDMPEDAYAAGARRGGGSAGAAKDGGGSDLDSIISRRQQELAEGMMGGGQRAG